MRGEIIMERSTKSKERLPPQLKFVEEGDKHEA